MGITVISAPAASTASTNALNVTAAPVSDGIAIDFASLLTGQIAGLPQATNSFSNARSVQESTTKEDKDSHLIRDLLSAQDPAQAAQNAIPNIVPTLENRPEIDVDSNSLISSNQQPNVPLSILGNDAKNTGPFNKPTNTESNRVLADVAPPNSNLPSKIDASLAASPRILTTIAQTPSEVTAILAGETSTNKTVPSTFATVLAAHTAQPQQTQDTTPSTLDTLMAAHTAQPQQTQDTTPSTLDTLMAGHTAQVQAQQTQHTIPSSNINVATPLQENRWAQDFSERIVWAAKNDQQVAQINISPAQLGPVQITLNMNGDQASIAFASPHAEVRKAIEDAMPNLKEMLSTAGISLGQSNVGAQLQQQQRDTNPLFANGNRSTGETAILPPDSHTGSISTGLPIQRGRGLVDLFA
ncbi:MAG: flagellar hook-length control protein FliK [Dechloromonas sp.]|uniref:Flagellar hook-length control protein FliK n=1 Tax=Candidatus Dechloromonas phosphorivorans TaxID=2899244 RepID=A0A935MY07_9RHOO|nr:flagellar hook-length control protein FliK [Candidatus Dechloromonas phosphorivorans]